MRRKASFILCGILLAFAFLLTGCIAPTTETKVKGELHGYKKVYLLADGEDPRKVYPRVAARLRETGFEVTVVDPDSPPVDEQGSGFVISPEGYVLTCAHVVKGMTNATIWVENVRYPCQVLNSDTNFDLALLKVEGDHPPFRPLSLEASDNYTLGQSVFNIGFPMAEMLGVSPRLNSGLVSAKVGLNDDTNTIQISVPIQPGNSGSPLMDANGEVIGVVSSTLNPINMLQRTGVSLPQNVNFAMKISSVRSFLSAQKITLPASVLSATNLDEAEKSIALVRGGDVSTDDLKERVLICGCQYQSIFNNFIWQFHAIGFEFMDAKSGTKVLTMIGAMGTYGEDKELDYLFAEISGKFFPDKPNPFNGK
jgi:serine protease Do